MRDRTAALLVLLCAWGTAGAAAPLSRDEVVGGLQAWLDGTRQLEARFEQELLSGALGAGLLESGSLYLERPGRMRWEYVDPESKTALIEGERMRLYVAEDEQMFVSTLPEDGELLPRLLAGSGRIVELFDADLVQEPGRSKVYRLRLVPRERSESFEEVELTLEAPRFAIDRAVVLDAAGNRVEYRFSRLRRNRGLPDDVFEFEPPPGTEIVDHP
jgi:outer membrane lipoprotein carrier protein